MFNRQERVLIDRITMVEVPNDQSLDPLHLREQKRQQAKSVHSAKRVGRMRLHQRFLQVKPQLGAARRRGGQRRQHLLNSVFGGCAQLDSMLRDEVKKLQQHLGVFERIGLLEKDQSVYHGKIGVGDAGSPALELPVQRRPRGRNLFLQKPDSLQDPEMLLKLFHFVAEHGVKLSTTTEYKIEQVLPALAATPPRGAELWLYLQETLVQPHAAEALRAMHALRLLPLLLPELKGIEALVVRDFYHRYTVDEHSILAIEHLHRLQQSKSEWDQRFAELLTELEQPELLYLSLLLHDSGKGAAEESHVLASLQHTDSCASRLDLDPADRETLRFLVANHLEMSAAVRRDVFDPGNVKLFCEKVGAPERLKMLCLMTFADIKAVNPEAMTPWKADNLWQLYIASANYLNRSADERVHTDDHGSNLAHLRSLAPVAGKKINAFLEGLPQRYLRIHGASDVLAHAEMAGQVGTDGVQLSLKQVRHWYELTLITTDRPFLFASVSGALAAWGMNIVKANAFSNAAGVVVDTFYFTDRFRTLELNIQEWERFKESIAAVVKGKADVARMLRDRLRSEKLSGTKVKIETQIEFNDQCSTHSTLMQVLTQDRPGLLYKMCSQISKHDCNIEIALIETEGQMAIDVLYLTAGGSKLGLERQAALRAALRSELELRP